MSASVWSARKVASLARVQSSPSAQVQQRLSFAQLIRARELESLLALDARRQRIERTIAEVR